MEPLVFKDRLTEDDVLSMSHYLGRLAMSRTIRWSLIAVFAACVACLGWVAMEFGHSYLTIVLFILSCAIFGMAIAPFASRWQNRRNYRKHSNEYLETQITLTPKSVLIENEKFKSDLKWDLFKTLIVTPRGLLFCYAQRQPAFWLPERLFADDVHRDQVIDLATDADVRIRGIN